MAALARAGARAGARAEMRTLEQPARTAADAAALLGCDVGAIANSLVFMADGSAVLVLTSGAHRVDTDHVARHLGVSRLSRATADQVRQATGQPIGGVAPVGHPRPLPTLVDVALAAFPVVWAAGGTPHTLFPTTCEELVRVCAGRLVTVADDGGPPAA